MKNNKCSGKVSFAECDKKATVLFDDDWEEIRRKRGEKKDEVYIVPDSMMISVRFPPRYIGQPVRFFAGK